MIMDVHAILPSPAYKSTILETNGKINPQIEIRPVIYHRNGYNKTPSTPSDNITKSPLKSKDSASPVPAKKAKVQVPSEELQRQRTQKSSLSPVCTSLETFDYLVRWTLILLRTLFVIANNLYCIPTYTIWMVVLLPIRYFNSKLYWTIEGRFFHWLLSQVSMWSYVAGYQVVESGDSIDEIVDKETMVLANHQSTSDVPLLMAAFNTRQGLLPNLNWIMDHVFKYTNFGIVSYMHGDFFVVSGKDSRTRTISELRTHCHDVYFARQRKWFVLFPEGGFLRKRRAVSQRFAEKNKLPHLEHVTIPRMGAAHAILEEIGPRQLSDSKKNVLKYILDITIAYPNGKPLDLFAITSGYLKPCDIHFHYRVFPIDQIPTTTEEEFQDWLFSIYAEKEKMLANYYETGKFEEMTCTNALNSGDNEAKYVKWTTSKVETIPVHQDMLRMLILHIFFILSTMFHWAVLKILVVYVTTILF